MKKLTTLLAIGAASIGGCVFTPEWNAQAAESVRPIRDMHRACMVANAASLDDGARNPRDIASTVEGLCAPLLEPMRAYIAQEGYGEVTADAYVEQVMTENLREAQAVVLRVRTEARKAP